ncbi:MAG: GGDEF domain-containing protein [Lachnospiraceae bacterium]|nr:GGDEF domain-containing protein [Lachnospiraceae bacterium]
MDISIYRGDIQNLIADLRDRKLNSPADVIDHCNKLEEYGREHGESALIGFAAFSRAEVFFQLNDMSKFYDEIIACMGPMEEVEEWGYLAVANNMLGIMSYNRGDSPIAVDYYSKAIRICKQYHLPDIEWKVHMNLGNLYTSVQAGKEAIMHLREGLTYINLHADSPTYVLDLSAACIGIGKAYMIIGDYETAMRYYTRLERECLPNLLEVGKIPVYAFGAMLFFRREQEAECQECIREVVRIIENQPFPIMEFIDDVYDFLDVLLAKQEYETYRRIAPIIMEMATKTEVRNMQRRLLTLEIEYCQAVGDEENYQKKAAQFYELSRLQEQENNLMISSMITMRLNFYDLVDVHRETLHQREQYQKKSETDPLTGMYNRLKINEFGEEAFRRAIVNQVGIGVEILDIDFFKEFNDNYGHQAGDKCIQFVADSILSLRRHPGVFCARYGGDEFVIIYEGRTAQEVFAIAKELKSTIVGAKYEHRFSRSKSGIVTISQGIFWHVPEEGQTMWNYLHEADNLLYKVKRTSRNSIMLGQDFDVEEAEAIHEAGDSFDTEGKSMTAVAPSPVDPLIQTESLI